MLDRNLKVQIKRAMRTAIMKANTTWLFSCHDCRYCVEVQDPTSRFGLGRIEIHTGNFECTEGIVPIPDSQEILGSSLPSCFSFNYANSIYANVYSAMQEAGVESYEIMHGWGTYVKRIIQRASKYGHLMNVTMSNLEKYK